MIISKMPSGKLYVAKSQKMGFYAPASANRPLLLLPTAQGSMSNAARTACATRRPGTEMGQPIWTTVPLPSCTQRAVCDRESQRAL